MSQFNELKGTFRPPSWLKVKGEWTCGQQVVDKFEQVMLVATCNVTNGFNVDGADIPFGFFVTIAPFNQHESKLSLICAPGALDTPSAPVFNVRTTKVTNLNEFICAATITKQVVAPATNASSGSNIWESTVTPIDDKHSELMVTTATSYNQVVSDEWDETLNGYVRITRELTQTHGASSVVLATGNVTHIFYQEVRCGWWVKVTEVFAAFSRSYASNVEFFWPGVFDFESSLWTNAFPLKNGSTQYYSFVQLVKEAYRGPCRAIIEESISDTTVGVEDIEVMQPLPIQLTTPFISLSIEPTLHDAFDYTLDINSDSIYEDVEGVFEYPATTPTDWPASVVGSWTAQPFRGVYFIRKVTVYPPEFPAP